MLVKIKVVNKHRIKRFLQRVALKTIQISNYPNKQKTLQEYEKECFSICKALIRQPNSIMLMSPISGKRYIESDDKQLFIIIEHNQITIVNHQYSYNISLWGKPMERLMKTFDIEIEKRREAMENEIRSNVKHSLSNIFKTIRHEKV